MTYRDFHYRWEYRLRSSPEKLWPFVADTNRFNRDAGIPALEGDVTKQRLRNARRLLRFSFLGMPVEWEEQPFEWIKPNRFGVTRKYSKGPMSELRMLAELKPTPGGGTNLVYEVTATPKSLLGVIAIPIQFGVINSRKISRAFNSYDLLASTATTAAPAQSESQILPETQNRLTNLREKLIQDGSIPRIVDKLIEFVEHADDFLISRIRPYALADEWNEPRRTVLEICLKATRAGLLNLQWDLLCPLCRGVNESETSLSGISSQLHCETCRIDFTVNFDRFVEITFRPNPAIRQAEVKDYCMGSPERTPHIVVQQLLAAQTERSLKLPLEEGNYRVRTLELPGERMIKVGKVGMDSAVVQASDRVSGDELRVTTEPKFLLQNRSDSEQLFILERLQWSDQATTAAEVTALQIFRDLFSSEALRAGEQISVGTLTILFTDLRNSTQLYREIGDATAFGRVMNHFDVLKKAIAEEDGALVKTIGDAVMGVFRNAAAALKAMLNAQQKLAHPPEGIAPLTLKAGIHIGPCIAVTLNDRLDYFGSTVNMAARLEGLSTGNDVVISGAVYDDPDVQSMMKSPEHNLEVLPFEVELKGFDQESFQLWRVGRKGAAASR